MKNPNLYADTVLRGFVGQPTKIIEKTGTAFINIGQTHNNVTAWTTIQVNSKLVTEEIANLQTGDEIKVYGRLVPRENTYVNKAGQTVTSEELIVACYRDQETEVSSNGDGILLVSTRASRAEKRKIDDVQPLKLRETA